MDKCDDEIQVDIIKKIEIVRGKIKDLESRLPAHSITAAMIIELDELEGELNHWIS